MSRCRRSAAALAGLLGALVLAAGAAPTPANAGSCGQIYGEGILPQEISAGGVSCHTARKLASAVSKVPSFGGCTDVTGDSLIFMPCVRMRFRCATVARLSRTELRIRCGRGASRVRFVLR